MSLTNVPEINACVKLVVKLCASKVVGMFGRAREKDVSIGDVLFDRVSKSEYEVVAEILLNEIPHVKLRCRGAYGSSTKTLAKSAVALSFTCNQADIKPVMSPGFGGIPSWQTGKQA